MVEIVIFFIYNGIYLDVLYYYYLMMNGGEWVIFIDEVLLDWCFNLGIKFDFWDWFDGYVVSVVEVDVEFKWIGYVL